MGLLALMFLLLCAIHQDDIPLDFSLVILGLFALSFSDLFGKPPSDRILRRTIGSFAVLAMLLIYFAYQFFVQ